MKLLPLIVGILMYLHVLIMAFLNKGQLIHLAIFSKSPISINSQWLFLTLALYSAIAMFLICYSYIISLNFRLKKQQRNTEKASIVSQDNSDKLRNLQAKIDTLEMALKAALKK